MNFDHPVLLVILGLVVCTVLFATFLHLLSPEARLERRRRRNNHRIITKVRRPMVRLSVRSRKP